VRLRLTGSFGRQGAIPHSLRVCASSASLRWKPTLCLLRLLRVVAVTSACLWVCSAFGIGEPPLVQFGPTDSSFALVNTGLAAVVQVDEHDWPGVIRAVNDLRTDIGRVTGITPSMAQNATAAGASAIIIGTMGKSRLIEQLIRDQRLDIAAISNQWEAAVIQVIKQPLPGIENALVIAGSDKRGTIYAIYTLSEQMGVSPWYWWADVPVQHRKALFVHPRRYVQRPPVVKYRGIFLNDEAPALAGWAREKFGGLNHSFYTNVFELLLRLKANYLWPAMWDNSFATDDPLNAELADEYGIVMGTSHHEPMMRAWKEWSRAGNGPRTWDYAKNDAKLRAFWTEGLRRTRPYEKIVTLGMRGDGDEPMTETDSIGLLERIVADQRKLIGEIIEPDVVRVPQSWALYKEVQGYYERGMRVPDDVTLLWCDDNWGNLRRLPTPAESYRSGGAGIYYHFDYVGGPRNYKWLNTIPLPKIREQMNLAYHHDAVRIWIVNVGDLKPMEIPIEFFLTFARDPERWPQNSLNDYLRLWATREFGPEHAVTIADLVAKYSKYNGRRKPELLEPDTFSLVNYDEADRVVADWQELRQRAEWISGQLPRAMRDAFFELVLHPITACDIVNELYIAAAKNRLYARQGRAGANDYASKTRALFRADAQLTDYFHHQLAGGKWDKMMSQTHIGYTGWQEPPVNIMPVVRELDLPSKPALGVALDGSTDAWPGSTEPAALSQFDRFGTPRRFIDVFNRGTGAFDFEATASTPWLLLSTARGHVEKEQRLWVSVDWNRAPTGTASGTVTISGPGPEPVVVQVKAFKPAAGVREHLHGFVESDGYVAMEASHYTARHDTATAHWEVLPDDGRTDSAMTVFPVTAPNATPPLASPSLEYEMYLFSTGRVEVALELSPSLNYAPERGVRIAVSMEDSPPQLLTVVPNGYIAGDGNRDWEQSVKDSIRVVKCEQVVAAPGQHKLKVWMVNPGVVLQRIVVDAGGVRTSYLGPPESYRAEEHDATR
jgi:hypothetical protein